MKYLINYKLFEGIKNFEFKFTQEDEYINITAYDGENKVGSISFHMEMGNEEDWHYFDDYIVMITDVSVDENYQRIGLGAELMKKCLKSIKKQYPFIKVVILNASPTGIRNKIPLNKLVEFYKRFGFKEFAPEGNNVVMVKNL